MSGEVAAVEASHPWRKRGIVIALVALAAIVAFGYWLYSRQFETTDDAEIDGDLSVISPRVSGTVKAVRVIDNQRVAAGDPLVEIDPADLEIALARSEAAVAQAAAQLGAEHPSVPITDTSNHAAVTSGESDLVSSRAAVGEAARDVEELAAQLAQAEASDANAQLVGARAVRLASEGAMAISQRDQQVATALASTANVDALRHALQAGRERVAQQRARVETSTAKLAELRANGPLQVDVRKATVMERQAELDLAKAELARAQLDLSYTKINAPTGGVIGQKSITVGDQIAPGQQLMAISPTQGLWVTANFRETQLQRIRLGQAADVSVDALGKTLHGKVASIAGATGSRFSVLPPDNATGNYVKVVQRVPVRIDLDPDQAGMDRVSVGMSVEVKVHVR